MRQTVRSLIHQWVTPACQRSGLLNLARRALHRRSLTVVMFHRVLPLGSRACQHSEREYVVGTEEFDRCLAFFGRHYSVVTLDQVEAAAAGGRPLPPHPLLITFDDGWHDNVEHAEPILRRHGMKATMFVNTDAVRQSGLRWWQDALVEAVRQPAEAGGQGRPAAGVPAVAAAVARSLAPALTQAALTRAALAPSLTPAMAAGASASAAAASVVPARPVGPGRTRPDFFTTLALTLQRPLEERLSTVLPVTDYRPEARQMLTMDEVSRLDPTVWEVGSHGVSHAPLTHVTDPEGELQESSRLLTMWMRQPIRAMSMPHGRYSEGIARAARAVYSLVFTSDPFLTMTGSASLQNPIGRIHVPSSACVDDGALARYLWIRRQR